MTSSILDAKLSTKAREDIHQRTGHLTRQEPPVELPIISILEFLQVRGGRAGAYVPVLHSEHLIGAFRVPAGHDPEAPKVRYWECIVHDLVNDATVDSFVKIVTVEV